MNAFVTNAIIEGNLIGLNATGNASPATGTNWGVFSASENLTVTNNVIAGHSVANIFMELVPAGTTLPAQTITNNFIGTNVTGTSIISPQGVGIVAFSVAYLPSCFTISGNTISGNTYGIVVGNNGTIPIIGANINANFIGTDPTGSFAVPNSADGILIDCGINTFITSNVISGNAGNYMIIEGKNTTIRSNFIGTNSTGVNPIPNTLNGIQLGEINAVGVSTFGDIIGGALSGAQNVIAYNEGNGIALVSHTQQETIQGNYIFNNSLNGIRLGVNSSNNWMGGFRDAGNDLIASNLISLGYTNTGPLGTSNIIHGNGLDGIALVQSNENALQTNIIYNNAGTGISMIDSSENLMGGNLRWQLPRCHQQWAIL